MCDSEGASVWRALGNTPLDYNRFSSTVLVALKCLHTPQEDYKILNISPQYLGLQLSNFKAVFWDEHGSGLLLCQQCRAPQVVYVHKSLAK